ncbi:MAG: WXG100 family type VII secretion target [Ruminococcus sp.]|nr:WXG100 family type VII secretion target [Ruminococcus sp.]
MADIVYRFTEMRAAAAKIEDIAARYKTAAATFQKDFAEAVSGWEGASKDKMTAFIAGPVNDYMDSTVPSIVSAMAALLNADAEQMEKADQAIADNIPESLT